jgi:glycosyltransferase involved in cell wall biosynthesis
MPRLALVVPCFNERHRLDPEAFLAWIRAHPDDELVFVDDGSTDDSPEVLREIEAAADGRARVVALEANAGKAEAVRRGVEAALEREPDYFGYWDADLSTPLDQADALVDRLASKPDALLAMGSRVKLLGLDIRRRAWRHYLGRVFATLASMALDLAVYDTQCGAKVLRSTRWTRWAFGRPFLSRWLFDVEILARLGLLARRGDVPRLEVCVVEHALPVWRDVGGSKVGLLDYVVAAWDLLRIAVRYRCCAARELTDRTPGDASS